MLKKSDDFQITLQNYRNTPPKGHTYSPAQCMMNRWARTTPQTPDHLLAPTTINSGTITEEIKAKRSARKAHYDKRVGHEYSITNTGKFVYARPPPRQPGTPWVYGRVTDIHHPRSYTIKTPSSTICRNRIHIRRATTPASTPTLTSPQHLPSPRHSPLHHHSSQGSGPTTSTDQSHQPTLPSPNTNNCALDPPPPCHTPMIQAHLEKAKVSHPLLHLQSQTRIKPKITKP